jgi:hypothetical protein
MYNYLLKTMAQLSYRAVNWTKQVLRTWIQQSRIVENTHKCVQVVWSVD